MDKRILVVTSCTGEKLHKPTNELIQDDFRDSVRLKSKEADLAQYRMPAGTLYTGKQHSLLMKGINDYRAKGGRIDVDILSAGYGMLREDQLIVPYEVTFSTMKSMDIKLWSSFLHITDDLQKRIEDYDIVVFLLGDRYLQAVNWSSLETRGDQKLIFFAGKSSKNKFLIRPNFYMLKVSEKESKVFHSGLIEIKGYLFSLLLNYIQHEYGLWNEVYQDPNFVRNFVLQSFIKDSQIALFEGDSEGMEDLLTLNTIYIPEDKIAVNYGVEVKYFMPENDDRVDPNYDFMNDVPNRIGDPLDHDVYSHQLHVVPQYDGVLISMVNINIASQKKKEKISQVGIRNFLRLPDDYPIMGDCGAFSYLNEEEPPYTTEQVLEYYHLYGFDYGVSVDHLIVGAYSKDHEKRMYRYKLTLNNARDFIEKYSQNQEKYGYKFTPIGVAQGWDPISFRNAVQELITMGYDYVALGGLAMAKSLDIVEILKEIAPIIPHKKFRMHLFGVVRDNMEYMKVFSKLGVTSFDSAAPLRRAWLGSEHNYYSPGQGGRHYAAIRIPEATASSPRVKLQIKNYLRIVCFDSKENYTNNDLEIEDGILKALKAFDKRQLDSVSSIKSIQECVDKIDLPIKSQGIPEQVLTMFEQLKRLEQKALATLRAYNEGNGDMETTLQAILEYDEKLGENREKRAAYYRELLVEQPWKRCNCNICKELGVEVIIFRGNNRNRRRGFHNTYVFYGQINRLKDEIRKEQLDKAAKCRA